MGTAYRRLVLKPSGLDEEQAAQLKRGLEAAIEDQRRLAAKSAHILVLEGPLEEGEDAFFVAHEPAAALPVDGLFDRQPRADDEETLLDWASALLDALRSALGLGVSRPLVHGGMCPGVLVRDLETKTLKLTDFGFAPAICEALGPEAYKRLCVGSPPAADGEPTGTGAWEVLAPEIVDRDSRICSFIDPEKYGSIPLHSFEPSGDLFAAGVLLYLLAHHGHPYLAEYPDSHRSVDEVEWLLPTNVPSTAFRDDLRAQTDTPASAWCELVAKLIDRDPAKRPPADSETVANYLSLHPPEEPPDRSDAEETREADRKALEDQKARRRKRFRVAVGGLACVALVVGAGILRYNGSPDDSIVMNSRPPATATSSAPAPKPPTGNAVAEFLEKQSTSAPPDDIALFVQPGAILDLSALNDDQIEVVNTSIAPEAFTTTVTLPTKLPLSFVLEYDAKASVFESAGPVWQAVRKALDKHRRKTFPLCRNTFTKARNKELAAIPFPAGIETAVVAGNIDSGPLNAEIEVSIEHTSRQIKIEPSSIRVQLVRDGVWQSDWVEQDKADLHEKLLEAFAEAALDVVKEVLAKEPYFALDSAPLRIGTVDTGSVPSAVPILHGDATAFTVLISYDNDTGRIEATEPLPRLAKWIGTQQETAADDAVGTVRNELPPAAAVLDVERVGSPGRTLVIRIAEPNQNGRSTTLNCNWEPASLAYVPIPDNERAYDVWLEAFIVDTLTDADLAAIGKRLQAGWLEHCPVTVSKTNTGKLHVVAAFPWDPNEKLESTDDPPILGLDRKNGSWDQERIKGVLLANLSKAAEASASGLENFLGSWGDRIRLEGKLPTAELGKLQPMGVGEAWEHLIDLANIKWHHRDFQPNGDLDAWTKSRLQEELKRRMTRVWRILPTRFIEYFWGPAYVHAIYWYKDGPDAQIDAYYVKLARTGAIQNQMRAARGPKGWAPLKVNTLLEQMGSQLLGPIVSTNDFFKAFDGTFAVAVAPDGPLLYLPFAQLPFAEQRVSMQFRIQRGGGRRQPLRTIERLADLCIGPTREFLPVFTAVWTLPSLLPPVKPGLNAAHWEPAWRIVDAADATHVPKVAAPKRLPGNLTGGKRVRPPAAEDPEERKALIDILTQLQVEVQNGAGAQLPPKDVGFWQGRLPGHVVFLSDPITEGP